MDIETSGAAYVSLQTNGHYGLYTLNLSSGAVSLVGKILDGLTPIVDIAVAPKFSTFLPTVRR